MGGNYSKTHVKEKVMHKFFVDEKSIDRLKGEILIEGEDVNHITKVLRLKRNEEILVCNGYKDEFICVIEDMNKKNVACRIIKSFKNKTEPEISITLFQGLPKSQKMDFIIQKCVEIGVTRIQTVITKRVVVNIEGKDISGKIERWRRISEEAAKQSNRGIVPKVCEPIEFERAVREINKMDIAVVSYEKEESTGLKHVLKKSDNIKNAGIFIGPEGGFEENEIEECIKNNIIPVTLGPRILRTETAGFVTASFILYELGDMGGNK